MSKSTITFLLLLTILGIAVFFRFYRLDRIPPGLYPDVAINGNDALDSLKTGQFKLFYPENNGREGMIVWLDALSIYLFGAGVYALKFPAALAGVLTVIGLYFLGKELFGKKGECAALLASFFLATSFWHVNFSRIGFRAILVPFFFGFRLLFFHERLQNQKKCLANTGRNFFWRRFLHLHQLPPSCSTAFCRVARLVSLLLAGKTANKFFAHRRHNTNHYFRYSPSYRPLFPRPSRRFYRASGPNLGFFGG